VLVGIFYTCGSYYQGVYGPRKNKQQELAKRQEQEKQAVVAMANLSPAPTPVPASTPTPVAVSTQTPVPTQDTVSEFKAIVNRVANSNYVFMNTFRVVKCNYDVVQTDSLVSPVQGIISVLYGYEQGHPDLHQYIICNITFNLKNGQWVAANYSETLMFFGIYNIDKKHQWIQHEGFPKGIVLP
ncbi:TPA: hypothetical protein DDW35_00105, partial [Candidatus Sumerlaeota bacterium]|nr:hypothetical protein [Candidatus Sumerlaeota bacterium]